MSDKIAHHPLTLILPRFRQDDWSAYLISFFDLFPGDTVAEAINMQRPELVTTMALFKDHGMSTEQIKGFLQGIAFMQVLHTTHNIIEREPPIRMDVS